MQEKTGLTHVNKGLVQVKKRGKEERRKRKRQRPWGDPKAKVSILRRLRGL